MGGVLELSRVDARRIAVRAQLLDSPSPGQRGWDVMDVVRHLTFVQYDVTKAVALSHHLVLWSRLGAAYSLTRLQELLDEQALVELHMRIRPADDLALYRAEMAEWPGHGPRRPWQDEVADWVQANSACRLDVLALLRSDGPLPISELPDTCQVPWRSTGWTNNKNVQKLVDFLIARGEIAVSGREHGQRLLDLAERVYPDDPVPDPEEAGAERDRRRLASLGIARSRAPATPNEPDHVGAAGEPAVVEGVRGRWRVDRSLLDSLAGPFAPRAALLSPLDRLVFDRKRVAELFEFDYLLEMYKPAAQRRWGYWAMPVLYGDRLVGKLDATSDPEAGELIVNAVHQDEPWSTAARAAVHDELESLAGWLDLALVLP